MKHKSPNLLKPLGIIIQKKILMLPLLRADLLISVHSETPCSQIFFTEKNSERFGWFLIPKNDFECININFANLRRLFIILGRSDDDMAQ
jgi:hypothetical protein